MVLMMMMMIVFIQAHRITKLPLTRKISSTAVLRTQPLTKVRGAGGSVPLHGDFPRDGEYYMDITIGGHPVSVLIDTGSSDMAVFSDGCNGCSHKADGWYNPAKSKNATMLGCDWCDDHSKVCDGGCNSKCKKLPSKTEKACTFSISYEDKSGFSAVTWEDEMRLGDMPGTRSVVGAMYKANFPNPKGVDGIIGLADPTVSDSGASTPIDDLVSRGD